jgi:hypothetical protein
MLATGASDLDSEIHRVVDKCRGSEQMEVMNTIRKECQRAPDILATLRGRTTMEELLTCQICHRRIRDRLKQVRHAIWTKLPELFQLED